MTLEMHGRRRDLLCAGLIAGLLCALTIGRASSSEVAPQADGATCRAPQPARTTSYLLASQTDIVVLLPPPPPADSAEQKQDLQAVLQAQRSARASGTIEHALADAQADCGRFADALGPALSAPGDAAVLAFLNHAARDGAALTGPAKSYWHRTRPYAYSAEVEALGDVSPQAQSVPRLDVGARAAMGGADSSGCSGATAAGSAPAQHHSAADDLAHSSYPSGHAAFGQLCAILLADMVPEKRAALFARSLDYSRSRLMLGAHFPSDVEAGRLTGTLAAELLMQNAQFQLDFAAARRTLRATMGLPDAVPELAPEGTGVASE